MPLIGYLHIGSLGERRFRVAAFQRGLSELGFVEGRNVRIEYRWADGQYDRLPAFGTDLARRQVAVVVAGVPPAALAAKAATSAIPIVFISGTDPVNLGLVASLNRPGGNLTGVGFFSTELTAKLNETPGGELRWAPRLA